MSDETSNSGTENDDALPRRIFDRAKARQQTVAGLVHETIRRQQFSATRQIHQALEPSLNKVIGSTVARQFQTIAASLAPLSTLRSSIPWLEAVQAARPLSVVAQAVGAQRAQMLDLMQPRWNTSLIGSALSETVRQARMTGMDHIGEVVRQANFDAVQRVASTVGSVFANLQARLPSLTEIGEALQRLPERVRDNLVALAEAGWYLDPEMPYSDLTYFREELAEGSPDEVHLELAGYFRDALDRIEQELTRHHSKRERFIRSALASHRTGDYASSIPLLFAQADGICFDCTGYQLFANGGLRKYAKRIDPDTLEHAYLEPLLRETPMTESGGRRAARGGGLNRHAVLHGESLDYDSEANSLKAVSFLNFVSYALRQDSSDNGEFDAPHGALAAP